MPTQAAAGTEAAFAALAAGDCRGACSLFEAALEHEETPEALHGLGGARWSCGDSAGAVAARERAYSAYRRRDDVAAAARTALWLAGEYAAAWGNEPASAGWLARGERLLASQPLGAGHGWLALARAGRAAEPGEAAAHAEEALGLATRFGDPDLELRALAALGLAEVRRGEVDSGLARFDEAMAGATGGEPELLETLAEIACGLVAACELASDEERPRQWARVLESAARGGDDVQLLAFCRVCSAEVAAASGRGTEAERELTEALHELVAAGQQARCVHPAARLAEIRVRQGRLAEAEELIASHEAAPQALEAAVAVRLARGEPAAAAALLERRLGEIGPESLLAAPLLDRLVEARLAQGELAAAGDAARSLAQVADASGAPRAAAAAELARGRVALAEGDAAAAAILDGAVGAYECLRRPFETARARLELARAVAAAGSRELALDHARRAHAELERLGAETEAAVAAALARQLGGKVRSGPRSVGLLTRREHEVLRLLAEGLTNAQIAGRLYISAKTAEHHVGRILGKLGLRSRAEAAAWAARNLGPE
jgi:DNA-binding CsgD family transcriptional regulator